MMFHFCSLSFVPSKSPGLDLALLWAPQVLHGNGKRKLIAPAQTAVCTADLDGD